MSLAPAAPISMNRRSEWEELPGLAIQGPGAPRRHIRVLWLRAMASDIDFQPIGGLLTTTAPMTALSKRYSTRESGQRLPIPRRKRRRLPMPTCAHLSIITKGLGSVPKNFFKQIGVIQQQIGAVQRRCGSGGPRVRLPSSTTKDLPRRVTH